MAAAITLASHIRRDSSVARLASFVEAVRRELDDSRSRVRYRFVERLCMVPELGDHFRNWLVVALQDDENEAVRLMATEALRIARSQKKLAINAAVATEASRSREWLRGRRRQQSQPVSEPRDHVLNSGSFGGSMRWPAETRRHRPFLSTHTARRNPRAVPIVIDL